MLRNKDISVKARLTSWIIEQMRLGVQCPEISTDIIERVEQRRRLSVPERADGLLEYLEQRLTHPRDTCTHPSYDRAQEEFYSILARIKSEVEVGLIQRQRGEIGFYFDYLEGQNLVRKDDRREHGGELRYGLTVAGYTRLEELRHTVPSSRQCFVAMWFDDSMQQARDEGILPAIRDTGYDPVGIDQKEHLNKIDDEIIVEIKRSRFVVADFTHGEKGARGVFIMKRGLLTDSASQ